MSKPDKPKPSWMLNPPPTMAGKLALIKSKPNLMKSPGAKGQFLRNMFKQVQQAYKEMMERAKRLDPLAYFKPSYEQALVLNAWMYGYSFVCIYSANRIGKTTVCIVNLLLWLIPNNPKWLIFARYVVGDPEQDPLNTHSEFKGQVVRVFPRPDISAIKRIKDLLLKRPIDIPAPDPRLPYYHPTNKKVLQWLQSKIPSAYQSAWPDAPWNNGGTIWFGGPDQEHHEKILLPLWRDYIPEPFLDRFVMSEREITIKITSSTGRVTCWELSGKSYESKDTKWSSGAVDAIVLTEGVTPSVWDEIKLRFKDPGVGSHDFTPYEAANAGVASALAYKISKGTEQLPLKYFVFTKFSALNAPRHIISQDKLDGLIKAYGGKEVAKARLMGDFFTSSMLILSNLNREIHLLPLRTDEMFQRWPNGRIYRGLDPGLDHPTACVWGYLLPTNQWIIYRIMAQAGLTIGQRCKKVIEMSNNAMVKVKWGPRDEDFYCIETHPNRKSEIVLATPTDYHTFKKDEVTGIPYSTNYIVNGLSITESIHTGPEQRGQIIDEALLINQYRPNPMTRTSGGAGVYFLQDEPGILDVFIKWEEYYWDRKRGGEDKGAPKDKHPLHGDDELDALGYLVASPYRWTNFRPAAKLVSDSEPEHDMIQRSQSLRRKDFATVANSEVVVFGDQGDTGIDEDEI